ncbi:hypothetical protein LTR85_009532 [Meristemomyces frigidus]|nr:hypothetical protein LTR85_009532 [Meristemomyces frigidus]
MVTASPSAMSKSSAARGCFDEYNYEDSGYYSDNSGEDQWPPDGFTVDRDLHNEVHPIFSRTNFPGADYDQLRPALKLASLFIDTDCLLDFWHAIFFGSIKEVLHGEGEDMWHLAYWRPRPKLSAKDVAMTRSRLRTLSHMVKFYRHKDLKGCGGETVPSEGFLTHSARSPFYCGDYQGRFTHVYYLEALYEEICGLSGCGMKAQYESCFSFAVLLVHEIAHVATDAASATGGMPFEDGRVVETGYEWSAHLFGGVPYVAYPNVLLKEWPSASIVRDYVASGWQIDGILDCSDIELRWHIPSSYIEQLFSSYFWELTVSTQGSVALKVPKARGFRYKSDEKGESRLFNPQREDDDVDLGLPEDCCVHDFGSGSFRPIAPRIEWEGLGRLMKIDHYELFSDIWESRSWHVAAGSSFQDCPRSAMPIESGEAFRWNETESECEAREDRESREEEGCQKQRHERRKDDDDRLYPPGLPGDLTNDIHPIFAQLNFPGTDYDKLVPALRLASLLIETECSLEFWHAMWFGPLIPLRHDDDSGWHWTFFRSMKSLSAKDKAMTRSRLRTLAHMMRFHRSKDVPGGGEVSQDHGWLGAGSGYWIGDLRGGIPHVLYGEDLYQELCELDGSDDSPETQMRLQLQFAVLLVHEAVHAGHIAAYGDRDELPFEYNKMAEAGYDWENHIIGGGIRTDHDDEWPEQVVIEWPSPSIYYTHLGRYSIWSQGDCADIEVRWFVPYSYIRRLFSTSFWDEVVPAMGAAALKVPRLHGLRTRVSKDGSTDRFLPCACDESLYEALPEGCYVQKDGYIAPLDPAIHWDGFGRLMRIECFLLFPEARQSRLWRQRFPALIDSVALCSGPDCGDPEDSYGGAQGN